MTTSSAHATKMIARRAEQCRRPGYRAGRERDKNIAKFCAYWQFQTRKNGLGSKQARAKFLASEAK